MTFLLATETAVPGNRHAQSAVAAGVMAWAASSGAVDPRLVDRVFSRAGVETRSSLRPLSEVFIDEPFSERNQRYRDAIVAECTKVAQALVARTGIRSPDLLVSSSCTGFMIPAVDAYVANELKMGPWLARLPITEAGCAGGAVALSRAHDFLTARPAAAALVMASEFSSLTFQAREFGATNIVATALFADGTAGMMLVGDEHRHAQTAVPALRLVATASYFLSETLGAMGYDVISSGLRLVLDKRLPEQLRGRLSSIVAEFLNSKGLRLDHISRFAIHPGGRRVLDVVSDELQLGREAQEPSRSVLREHGNMSSATLLFVLKRALSEMAPGDFALGVGFGPGFGVELSLWGR